jgi:hypothetical protein
MSLGRPSGLVARGCFAAWGNPIVVVRKEFLEASGQWRVCRLANFSSQRTGLWVVGKTVQTYPGLRRTLLRSGSSRARWDEARVMSVQII